MDSTSAICSERIVSTTCANATPSASTQRKIALDRRKPRQRFEASRGVGGFDAGDERFELQFGDEDILAEFI